MLLFISVIAAAAVAQDAPARGPNIVLIVADDLGWADIGSFGCTDISTPHLDHLTAQGVRFPQFYSNGSSCTPTRAALLTGRYQQRIGGLEAPIGIGGVGRYDDAVRLNAQGELGLPVEETSIARMLRDAGYATALIGKWHLGYEDRFSPNRHGFDHAFYCVGGGMDYFHHLEHPPSYAPVLRLNEEHVQRRGYFTDLIADDALDWLRRQTARDPAQPFFLYVPFTAPHTPHQAPDEEREAVLPPDSPRWIQGRAPAHIYGAVVERMDHAVGRILAALDEMRLSSNTLVIFVSDNGGSRSMRPSGLRGFKGQMFEGGIRVPAIVRWPGVLPAGSDYGFPSLTFDLTVSIARVAGVNMAKLRPFDGIDILHFVERGEAPPSRALFWRSRGMNRTWYAVREGTLKYVSDQNGDKIEEWLFDLQGDLGEQNDLRAQRPGDVARLKRLLTAWETEVRPMR